MAFVSTALLSVSFAFPEWISFPTGETTGIFQNCFSEFESSADARYWALGSLISKIFSDEENDTVPEPEPEPDCIVKSSEEFENELWTIVPISCGVFLSVIGKNIQTKISAYDQLGFVLIGIDNKGRLTKTGADRNGSRTSIKTSS